MKKGQISLSDAPTVVMIVGFVFLIMATVAYVGSEYGNSFSAGETATIVNESVTNAELTAGTVVLDGYYLCNAEGFSATVKVYNTTSGTVIDNGNYTYSASAGTITNTTGQYTDTWLVNYNLSYAGNACNITTDLNEEILDNTSIAGVVLTISLVGIILSILIGIFVASRRRGL